jgi:hypothetical protein
MLSGYAGAVKMQIPEMSFHDPNQRHVIVTAGTRPILEGKAPTS